MLQHFDAQRKIDEGGRRKQSDRRRQALRPEGQQHQRHPHIAAVVVHHRRQEGALVVAEQPRHRPRKQPDPKEIKTLARISQALCTMSKSLAASALKTISGASTSIDTRLTDAMSERTTSPRQRA